MISAICVGAVLYFADLRRLLEALRHADIRMVLLGVLTSLSLLLVRTMLWRTLLM